MKKELKHLTQSISANQTREPDHISFLLEDWQVHPSRNSLERSGQSLSLEPKTMAVLVCLAEHAGDVVSADALITKIWNGRPMGDNPVYKCIAQLRRHLGDNPRQPRYIETIARRGYRLVAKVEPLPPPSGSRTTGRMFPPWPTRLLAGWLSVALLLSAMAWWQAEPTDAPDSDAQSPRLLLLPIEALNGDGLAGVSETALRNELEAALSQASGLDLVDYRHWREGNLEESPTHMLGGSLLVRDGRYRLSLDLSNGQDGVLWSEQNEFHLAALPAALNQVVQNLTRELGVESPPKPVTGCGTSTDTRACQLYLMAMDFVRLPGPFDQARAGGVDLLEQSLELDSNFAAAHAALAVMLMKADAAAGNNRLSERSLAALERAETLAPNQPEVMAARGLYLAIETRNLCTRTCGSVLARYQQAEVEFRQALALRPDLVHARVSLAIALQGQGRFHDAFDQVMLALAHDPMNPDANYQRVFLTGLSGDLEAAERLAHEFRLGHPQGAQLMDRILASVRMANGDAAGSMELLIESSRLGHDREFHNDLPLVARSMLQTDRHDTLEMMLSRIEDGQCDLGTVPWQRPHVEARLLQIMAGATSAEKMEWFRRTLSEQLEQEFGAPADWPRWGLRTLARLHSAEHNHDQAVIFFELLYDANWPELDQLDLLSELAALHDFASSLRIKGRSAQAERLIAHALDLIDTRRAQGQRGLQALEQWRERHLALLGEISKFKNARATTTLGQ
jgi:DNA-binding winged helix-turn-helix (wHTH) protein/tetratricopeptide (TPR) repeat protein